MKRFEVDRKNPAFWTCTGWLVGQVPELEEPFKELRMIVFTRTMIGCCALLVFWKQEQAEAFELSESGALLRRAENALMDGLEKQCGIKLASLEAAF